MSLPVLVSQQDSACNLVISRIKSYSVSISLKSLFEALEFGALAWVSFVLKMIIYLPDNAFLSSSLEINPGSCPWGPVADPSMKEIDELHHFIEKLGLEIILI